MDSRTVHRRPTYHFAPTEGWLNDPNGLVYHDGVYHLFYQAGKERRRWDHATSPDLVTWTERGTKIPATESMQAFSGGAVIDRENTAGFGEDAIVCLHTGHHDDGTEDQRLAYSTDGGETMRIYEGNPVIESDVGDFRDPNPFRYEPDESWRLVVSRVEPTADRPAGIEIYSSENLVDWTYESTYRDVQREGWECPSLLERPVRGTDETRWVLAVSPIERDAVDYHIGRFDGAEFVVDEVVTADRGYDCYATQHWSNAPDERGLHISWMSNWNYARDVPDPGWQGAMTLPRTLALERCDRSGDLEVRQRPAIDARDVLGSRRGSDPRSDSEPEPIAELRDAAVAPDEDPLADGSGIETGRALELRTRIDPGTADAVGLRFRDDAGFESVVAYDATVEELRFDRTNADAFFGSDYSDYGDVATSLGPLADGTIELRAFVDRCSVELFANEGRRTMTNLVYPHSDRVTAELFAEGGTATVDRLVAYELEHESESPSARSAN